jgi:hypothetical protein
MDRDQPDHAPRQEQSPDPEFERLRRGYIQELELANCIMAASPDEIVLHYGNPPEIQGPDALSIGPDRLITKWDTGWRRVERSVGLSSEAEEGVDRALVEASVWKEVNSGRLPLELGLAALRSFDEGNYNICRVGRLEALANLGSSAAMAVRPWC